MCQALIVPPTNTVLYINYTQKTKQNKCHWVLCTQMESPLIKAVEKQPREEQD